MEDAGFKGPSSLLHQQVGPGISHELARALSPRAVCTRTCKADPCASCGAYKGFLSHYQP